MNSALFTLAFAIGFVSVAMDANAIGANCFSYCGDKFNKDWAACNGNRACQISAESEHKKCEQQDWCPVTPLVHVPMKCCKQYGKQVCPCPRS
jgi:hypothetical protein